MQAKHFVNSAVFSHSLNLRDSECKLQRIARWIWMFFLSKHAPTTPSKCIKKWNKMWICCSHFNPANGKGTLVNQHNASLLQLCYLFFLHSVALLALCFFGVFPVNCYRSTWANQGSGTKECFSQGMEYLRDKMAKHQSPEFKQDITFIWCTVFRNVRDTVAGKKIFAIFSGHD